MAEVAAEEASEAASNCFFIRVSMFVCISDMAERCTARLGWGRAGCFVVIVRVRCFVVTVRVRCFLVIRFRVRCFVVTVRVRVRVRLRCFVITLGSGLGVLS